MTDKGSTKGRPQVLRKRADKLISGMIDMAAAINADTTMMHRVTILAVFGSYLSDKAALGDLDIAIKFAPLWSDGGYEEMHAQFLSDHPPPASIANVWFDRMMWPERFLCRRMKVGRGISLHDYSELEVLGCPYEVFFDQGAHGVDTGK